MYFIGVDLSDSLTLKTIVAVVIGVLSFIIKYLFDKFIFIHNEDVNDNKDTSINNNNSQNNVINIDVGKSVGEIENIENIHVNPDVINSSILQIINKRLYKTREKLKADRTWIGKFHNGNDNEVWPSNNKFQLFSVIESSERAGISSIKLRHIPTVMYIQILEEIVNNGYFYAEDISKIGLPLASFFENNGIKSILIVGIYNKHDQLVGMFGADDVSNKLKNEDKDIEFLKEESKEFSSFLPIFTFNKREEDI